MSDTSQKMAASGVDETTQRFILWSLAAVGLPAECGGPGLYAVSLPEARRAAWKGAERLQFAFDPRQLQADSAVQLAAPGTRFYCWLADELRRLGAVAHAVPKQQPTGVHGITRPLFDAFQIDGGSVHLRGCTFDDLPLLRLTYRTPAGGDWPYDRLTHVYAGGDGAQVEEALLAALHVEQLAPFAGRPPRLAPAEIESWLEAGRRLGRQRMEGQSGGAVLEAATIIWCKFAVGKLAFAIGQNSVESAFAGWAQFYAERRIKPPPYACPLSGRQSYHLAATDDGRITVIESIATCGESGARVLENELETCEATGLRVLPAHLETCPVSGKRVARSSLAVCSTCRQKVSPTIIDQHCCAACRHPQPVLASDPRLTGLLQRHPKLQGWRKWMLAETAAVYVFTASSLLRRLLLVVEKEGLEPLRLASGSRFGRAWTDIPAEQRGQHLSE